jgi:hypothetical protein
MRGLEADPKFQNLPHWRRHQAPVLFGEFGWYRRGMGRQVGDDVRAP